MLPRPRTLVLGQPQNGKSGVLFPRFAFRNRHGALESTSTISAQTFGSEQEADTSSENQSPGHEAHLCDVATL